MKQTAKQLGKGMVIAMALPVETFRTGVRYFNGQRT